MDKITKIGCEVFILKERNLLLGKRKNCYGAGTWALPGGHLEYGEKAVDAAKRELIEELNIKDVDLKLLTVTDDISDDSHYVHLTFLLEGYQGGVQLMEPEFCERWEYFPLSKLPEELFPPHKGILQTFLEKKLYLH